LSDRLRNQTDRRQPKETFVIQTWSGSIKMAAVVCVAVIGLACGGPATENLEGLAQNSDGVTSSLLAGRYGVAVTASYDTCPPESLDGVLYWDPTVAFVDQAKTSSFRFRLGYAQGWVPFITNDCTKTAGNDFACNGQNWVSDYTDYGYDAVVTFTETLNAHMNSSSSFDSIYTDVFDCAGTGCTQLLADWGVVAGSHWPCLSGITRTHKRNNADVPGAGPTNAQFRNIGGVMVPIGAPGLLFHKAY